MRIEIGDILTLKGEEYAVIDNILYEGVKYILTNKFSNDEPTEIYIVYELVEDKVLEVTDKKILEKLLPIFSKNVQKIINIINLKDKYEIN